MATAPRLIIVCGLIAVGKSTQVKRLKAEFEAVSFSADTWMKELSVDLFDESARAKIEGLQWKMAQELLSHGLTIIVEWGNWSRAERDAALYDKGFVLDTSSITPAG